jgi:hypothetical protein
MTERGQVLAGHRLVGDRRAQRFDVDAEPGRPATLRIDARGDQRRELRACHHVERRPQRSRLDDRPVGERLAQLLLAEGGDTRPQRDVRRRRVLRLERDEPRDRLHDRQVPALQQHLAREQRAVQLTQ